MAWKLTAAPYCLLFLALALHTEAALPRRSMLDLHEESALAKLRFEAGDPVCRRFQFRYECFDVHTRSTQEPPSAAFVEDTRVLPEDVYPQDPSDCGPLGRHKYRCVPLKKTPIKNPAPEETAAAAVAHDAQVLPESPSDCGPLGRHKYRCVPPKKTPIKTPVPEEVSRVVDPSVEEAHEPAP